MYVQAIAISLTNSTVPKRFFESRYFSGPIAGPEDIRLTDFSNSCLPGDIFQANQKKNKNNEIGLI